MQPPTTGQGDTATFALQRCTQDDKQSAVLEVFAASARCAAMAVLGAFVLVTADCGSASASGNLAIGEQVFNGNCGESKMLGALAAQT